MINPCILINPERIYDPNRYSRLKTPQITQINIEMIIKSVKFAVAGYSNFFLFIYIQYQIGRAHV